MKLVFLSLLSCLFMVQGCVSDGAYSLYDPQHASVVLQTSSDARSAMPHLKTRGEIKSATSSLQATIESEPKNVQALLSLAQIYLATSEYDEALKLVRKALRYDLKSPLAKKILAQIYLRTQNTDMATIILNGLGGEASKDSEVLNMLAIVALSENRNSDAMALFRKGLELNPQNVSIRMNLGVLLLQYRQLAKAAIQFERVLKIIPEHSDAKLHLAVLKSTRGKIEDAAEIYQTILAQKSENPMALYNLAVLETKQKHYDDALGLLKSYLNSTYARGSNNDQVYTLVEEIELRKRSQTGLSDEEARSIAEKMNRKGNNERNSSVAKSPEPAKNPNESETKMIDDDIKALEQQLQ